MFRVILFILLFSRLFGYEVYVNTKADLLILNTLGIECEKKDAGYLCAKFKNIDKSKEFVDYLSQYGVKAYIKNENPVKTGYCIQISTSKDKNFLIEKFDKYKNYPYARVEKIGEYYVIRIAENQKKESLKPLLLKIKKLSKDAFLRKCDYIPSRIVYPKPVQKVIRKTQIKSPNFSTVRKLIPSLYERGEYETVLFFSNILQKSIYKKEALIYKAKAYFKLKNYEKACSLSEKLYNIYLEDNLKKLRDDSCFEFYLKKAKKELYTQPYEAYNDIKTARSYKNDKRIYKTMGLVYYNLGKFQKAYEIFGRLTLKKPSEFSIYAKILFSLGKFKELNTLCKNHNIGFCRDYKTYLLSKSLAEEGKYEKAYKKLYPVWQLYPEDKKINYQMAFLALKLNRIDEAISYLNKIDDDKKTAEMLRDAYYSVNDLQKAYYYASMLKDSSEENKKIYNAYLKYAAYNFYKNGEYNKSLEILNSLPEDIEVLELKGRNYLGLGDYKKALENYKQVYFYDPSSRITKQLIKLYIKNGDLNLAKDITDFKNRELSDTYYLSLARYYLQKNKIVNMNKTLENVSDKESNEYVLLKGILCYLQESFDCALNNLLKVSESKERNYYLIMTYIKLNQKNKAKNIFEKTYKHYSKEEASKVANILIQLGEIKKAKEILGF